MPNLLEGHIPPPSMSEDADDVRRALTIVFRGADGLARPDVERAFSFDMEWVAPHEAEEVVNALVAAGWLEERKQNLHLALNLGEVNVPFGWFPRPRRLLHPVSAKALQTHPQKRKLGRQKGTYQPRLLSLLEALLAWKLRSLETHGHALRQGSPSSFPDKAVLLWMNWNDERTARSRPFISLRRGWPTPWSLGNRGW